MISDFIFCREPLLRFPKKINNPNPSPIGNKFGLFLSGRSGETRTRGLLLPKQARYQLRNTPEKYYYSILFFAAFVNPEVCNFTLPLFVRIFIRKSGCKGRKG